MKKIWDELFNLYSISYFINKFKSHKRKGGGTSISIPHGPKNDEIYDIVHSIIIQQEPLPMVKQVVARICKEEQQKNLICVLQ